MRLSEYNKKKSNNLQVIRFIASIAVILSHSFAICKYNGMTELINTYTHDVLSLGGVSVGIFFVISGYLICNRLPTIIPLRDILLQE